MGKNSGARAAMAALLTTAAMGFASTAVAAGPSCLNVPSAKIGLQLYSLLTEIQPPGPPLPAGAPRPPPTPTDPAKLDSVYAGLAAIGWKNVENFNGNFGQGDAAYKAIVDRHGMKVVASHESLDDASFAAALDRAKLLGQSYIGSGGYGAPGLTRIEDVLATAARLNTLGQMAAQRGLKFYVHNHQLEFTNVFSYDLNGDGRSEKVSAWEIVEAKTDPRYVNFEIDIHWAHLAMGQDKYQDLTSFLRKHRSRIVLLHIKDTTPDGKIADLGRGTTDWSQIVAAAGPQIGYYLWEFDRPLNPMESAKIAYNFMSCSSK
jgi:sugar phosphate isomerase/epimerase